MIASGKSIVCILLLTGLFMAAPGCSDQGRSTDQKTGSLTGTPATVEKQAGQILGSPMEPDASDQATLYIVSPADGDRVYRHFKVIFGLSGMGVAPAGVKKEATGHHHLLIDVNELPTLNLPLPSTENIRHFGNGQTETWLALPPGEHTLQLLLGDFAHVPHAPPILSERITITVVK